MPRWSVYELALTASDAQRDPYLERDLVGVFTGPTGQSIVVNGFWDGERTFRLRFAPTAEGTWTYMTVSSDPAMDGQMGSIRCTAPQPSVHGFVRGQAGQTAQIAGWTYDDGAPASALVAQVVPLRESSGCGADCDVLGSMAHDHLSLTNLRHADQVVQEAQTKGTIAELQLFDAIDTSTLDDLEAHRVIDYALARYGAYTNVAWCLHPVPPDAGPVFASATSLGAPSARPLRTSGGPVAVAAANAVAPAAAAHSWTALRGVVRMDDPYFAESFGMRVVLSQCSADLAGPGGTL